MSRAACRWIEHRLVPGVRAVSTLRGGEVEDFGWNAGPQPRQRLAEALSLPEPPTWLRQVHGTVCVDLDQTADPAPEADAALTRTPGRAAVVQTADCLPVLLTHRAGAVVAAVHAGWRGLHAGVLRSAVRGMTDDPSTLVGVFGPAIGSAAFEVGPEVREAFLEQDSRLDACFRQGHADRWHADLYDIARRQLGALGVVDIMLPGWCTRTDTRFHSWRRDGLAAGRMAHLIWIEGDAGSPVPARS